MGEHGRQAGGAILEITVLVEAYKRLERWQIGMR